MEQYFDRILPAIPLFLMLAAIILGFNCVWRVERRLDTFLKLLTAGIVFTAIRKLVVVIGYHDLTQQWTNFVQYLDIIGNGLILFAMLEMYRIITILNK